jgi:hypothetical protein
MPTEADKEMEAVRNMIDQRLRSCPPAASIALADPSHLDEDSLSAFVESSISDSESSAIVSHLIACVSCRDASARLIRLESLQFEDDDVTIPEHSPSRLRQFLADLAAQVVPSSGEDAVFAYQNPDADQEDDLAKQKRNDSVTDSEK